MSNTPRTPLALTLTARHAPPKITPLPLALLLAAAFAGGCASQQPAESGRTPSDPSATTEAPGETGAPDPRDAETERRLALMQQAIASPNPPENAFQIEDPPSSSGEAHTGFWKPIDVDPRRFTPTRDAPGVVSADGVVSRPAEPIVATRAEPTLTRSEQVRKKVSEISALLRDDAREIGFMLPAWIRVASLEAIEPGALSAHYIPGGGMSDDAEGGPVSSLSQPEHDFLIAWRDMHTSTWEEADSADVARLAEIVATAAQRMSALRPLEIIAANLCTRVERFGVYDERTLYDGVHKLLAGKPQRLLVYMELENYAHREAVVNGVDGLAVDLTVGLSLHHLGRETDLLAWRMDDEPVTVFSRNQRREFFLTIIADMPETLSVDAYNLKARVTDENSGAVAERILRIDIVADTSAFTAASR